MNRNRRDVWDVVCSLEMWWSASVGARSNLALVGISYLIVDLKGPCIRLYKRGSITDDGFGRDGRESAHANKDLMASCQCVSGVW
jgi:hypothetical protein